jgi:hypothetical protein
MQCRRGACLVTGSCTGYTVLATIARSNVQQCTRNKACGTLAPSRISVLMYRRSRSRMVTCSAFVPCKQWLSVDASSQAIQYCICMMR